MKILVINCGSSSLKYQVLDMTNESLLCKGLVERIGMEGSVITHEKTGCDKFQLIVPMEDHKDAISHVLMAIQDADHGVVKDMSEIGAVGHRVVHAGEKFAHSVLIDDAVIKALEECIELAPLHNPPNLLGIAACQELMPDTPMVGVFDTAFHQSMPEENYIYPIPYEYYTKDKIRRYGMHGTSHMYLTYRLAEILNKPVEEMNIITCHLGNGASITAVKNGKSFKTSMGFTPLSGIMMGTRSGDIDPAIVIYLQKKYGYTPDEVDNILNKKSGMLGISGISSDGRDVEKAADEGNERAILTQKMYVSRIVETVSGYYGLMGGADAIVFAGGIGENDWKMRQKICDGLKVFGVDVPVELNEGIRGKEAKLSSDASKMQVWLIPTNEELMIARDAYKDLVNNA